MILRSIITLAEPWRIDFESLVHNHQHTRPPVSSLSRSLTPIISAGRQGAFVFVCVRVRVCVRMYVYICMYVYMYIDLLPRLFSSLSHAF